MQHDINILYLANCTILLSLLIFYFFISSNLSSSFSTLQELCPTCTLYILAKPSAMHMLALTVTHTHTHTHTHAYTYTHTYIHTYTHTHTCTHTHAHAHTYTYTYIHTCTHIHTHAHVCSEVQLQEISFITFAGAGEPEWIAVETPSCLAPLIL